MIGQSSRSVVAAAMRSRPAISTRYGFVRQLTRSSVTPDASQPAPPLAAPQPPHTTQATGGVDSRSRLAKLQAQRLEELNRGRKPTNSGSGKPNRPEQKWSTRTLIALGTSVGATMYLLGTWHGYNAGKAHVTEQAEIGGAGSVVPASAASVGSSGTRGSASRETQASSRFGFETLTQAFTQLLPFGRGSIQCEPEQTRPATNCRLAELTQYHCDLHRSKVVCTPIDRIFRV